MSEDASDAARAFRRQRAAMAVTDTTGPEKSVLIVLAIMANGADEAWPPVTGPTGLTTRCSLGERTVQRSLRGLEQLLHISRRLRPGGVIYRVHPATQAPRHTGTPPEGRENPATLAPKQPGTTIPQKATPSSEVIGGSRRGINAPAALPKLPPGTLPERWAAFVEMRVAMSKGSKPRPWTPGAAAASVRSLAKLAAGGDDPNEILEQSVANGWQGLHPLKRDDRTRGAAGGSGGGGEGRTMRAMRSVIASQRLRAGE